ncbi:metal-dependent hydrolase [Thermococcus sp. M39]|uniref:metal-dependent hydrolase n=1 Tax=unclassified Thermococcus TaxID=2627626 RepID=UPI00143922A9|nr:MULTISPECIES: metal-dependent hydrolase [unclassified Thermococcus]NJE07812.1 metal-dependent hydrolase [Thermococcus sp. M39]NJE12366.1 metal-dependent hydrolase [Thermococcus sp. LS2]
MDPLKHASIPLLAFLALSKNPGLISITILVFGAIFPDFDIFFGEHRGYFHSLLFLIPLFAASLYVRNIYLWMFAFGVAVHLVLDFFSGVIPFLYPLRKKGFGLKVSGIIIFERLPKIDIKYEILVGYPTKSRGSYVGFSNESLAIALVALIVLLIRLNLLAK